MNTPHAPEPRRFAPTTGLPGLDAVLSGVAPGDNIVWQIQSFEDYRALVLPYAAAARSQQRRLIYFRFAAHPALTPDLHPAGPFPRSCSPRLTRPAHPNRAVGGAACSTSHRSA